MAETSTIPVIHVANKDGSRERSYLAEIAAWLRRSPRVRG